MTYIAHDGNTIAGIGETPGTARLDAILAGYVSVEHWEQERDERGLKEWYLEPCTGALAAQVKAESGAIAWDYLPGRTACTVEEADSKT